MFDIGMTELLVVAVVAIIVVGPKDLPGLLRAGARHLGQLRSMARDFQGQMNEALRESELDSVKSTLDDVKNLNPVSDIKKQVTDFVDDATDFDKADDDYVKEGEKLASAAKSGDTSNANSSEISNDKSAEPEKAAESTSS